MTSHCLISGQLHNPANPETGLQFNRYVHASIYKIHNHYLFA